MVSLEDLNEEQRRAVEVGDGPVLIVAGPGTGKTKTLATRIAYVLHKGVAPDRILALTFTVKAADEMRQRVMNMTAGATPQISTFHALGHKILREALPDDERTFISETDRLALVRSLPRPNDLKDMTVRDLGLQVSRYKGTVDGDDASPLGRFVTRYQTALDEQKLQDFDDLLFRTYRLLGQNASLHSTWRARYDYIFVDEFQDTSELQWQLLMQIRGNDNMFVIGDPKQSIYGFRGASGDMFVRFRQDFPEHSAITLPVNYRSAQAIVELASAIFGGVDALRAHSTERGLVQAVQTLNEFSEADFVLNQIEQGIGGSDLLKASASAERHLKDFAVLYRTHQAARVLQQRLQDSGIPFQVVGEGSPYDQPEVAAVIGLLRRIAGHEALPPAGFSDTQTRELLRSIEPTLPVSKLAERCVEVFALAGNETKRRRLSQFASTLVRFDSADGLQKCLTHLERIAQEDFYDPSVDAVTLMTIHASKGLEFTHVIVIAAEEGILPHIRKHGTPDFDEERRLFYVAATRAKSQLDVVYAKKRKNEPRQPSRYITEVSKEALPRIVDPSLGTLEKKIQRREQKKRQTTLF